MTDEEPDAESAVEQPGYGDQLRRHAALARIMAEMQRDLADTFATLGEHDCDAAAMSDEAARAARGLDQVGSLHADAALAYDDMVAAGGPENSRAYVEYEATLRRHRTLWPSEGAFGR